MHMTLRHLEIFLAVCRSLSMTEAAQQLNMSQPAVSKAVRELEDFYHVSLFDRVSRKLFLTSEGETLMNYASTILSQYEESVVCLRDASVFRTCRLSVNVSVAETRLDQICQEIMKEIPDIDLRITVNNSAVIGEMLHGNECDLAVIDRRDDPMLESIPLFEEELVLTASDSYWSKDTITAEEVLSVRLLLREAGSGNRSCIDPWLREISFPVSKSWQCSSDEVLMHMAEKGYGIAVLPKSYVLKNSRLHPVTVPGVSFVRHFYLVYLLNKYLNRTAEQCRDVIAGCFKNETAVKI